MPCWAWQWKRLCRAPAHRRSGKMLQSVARLVSQQAASKTSRSALVPSGAAMPIRHGSTKHACSRAFPQDGARTLKTPGFKIYARHTLWASLFGRVRTSDPVCAKNAPLPPSIFCMAVEQRALPRFHAPPSTQTHLGAYLRQDLAAHKPRHDPGGAQTTPALMRTAAAQTKSTCK